MILKERMKVKVKSLKIVKRLTNNIYSYKNKIRDITNFNGAHFINEMLCSCDKIAIVDNAVVWKNMGYKNYLNLKFNDHRKNYSYNNWMVKRV
jgi:hypothetical protein